MSLDIAAPEVAELDYTAEHTQVLRDAAHIRKRPGMYIGDTATRGLHHLVYELVYNSVDEALAGYCKNIHVTIHVGRQPVASPTMAAASPSRSIRPRRRPTLEVVMTTVGAGAKFDNKAYKTPPACTAWAPRPSPP